MVFENQKPGSGVAVAASEWPSRKPSFARVALYNCHPEDRWIFLRYYRNPITTPEQAELLAAARRELRGFDLGCFCRLGLPCHADVLLELVNQD